MNPEKDRNDFPEKADQGKAGEPEYVPQCKHPLGEGTYCVLAKGHSGPHEWDPSATVG